MKNVRKNLFVGALVACAVVATAAAKYYGLARTHGAARQVPYTITWRVTDWEGGKVTGAYTETRYVSSSGNWRSVKQFSDGRTEETFAEAGRGVFLLKPAEGKMVFLSGHEIHKRDPEAQRRSPNYVGSDTLLGYAVHKVEQRQGETSVVFSHAAALNGDMIGMSQRDGDCGFSVEPVSIVEGEPGREALAHGELPADYEHYRKLHGKDPAANP